jgi:RND family efflux transporter MFP subunit
MVQPAKRVILRLFCISTSLAIALALISCAGSNGSSGNPGPAGARTKGRPEKGLQANRPAAVRVETSGIQRISIQRQVELAGTLISPDQARVSSEAPGVVRQVLVELGQEVQPGQALVRLDPRELEIALQRAESQLRQTEAQLGIDGTNIKEPLPDEQISIVRTAIANRDDARAQLQRTTQLMQKGLVPQADFDTAQTTVKVTEAAYQAALENVQSLKATLQERRAALELARKKVNDAVIRAPVGGSVSERLVQPGEFIRENTPVVTIVQMNPLKVKTAIQERYAELIRAGLPASFRVESMPDVQFDGKVAFISPAVDQATRTFAVEILVDNRERRLKPGFFTKGVIYTKLDQNVLAVPEQAISTLAGVSTVYIIDQTNTVKQQIVSLGARDGKLVEIVAGLEGTEVLAASNLSQLATGIKVEIGSAKGAGSPGILPAGKEPAGKSEGEME